MVFPLLSQIHRSNFSEWGFNRFFLNCASRRWELFFGGFFGFRKVNNFVLFPFVATMQLTNDEPIAFFQHVERFVDEINVVKIFLFHASLGKRLLIILPSIKVRDEMRKNLQMSLQFGETSLAIRRHRGIWSGDLVVL